jgi:hypothetical protein
VPHWVELNWSAPKTLAAARIVSGFVSDGVPNSPLTDFVLQYHDGHDWREIPGTHVHGNTMVDWQCRFEAVRVRRVRLMVEKTPGDVSRIWEIELYER